jgi:hypothetical protein
MSKKGRPAGMKMTDPIPPVRRREGLEQPERAAGVTPAA